MRVVIAAMFACALLGGCDGGEEAIQDAQGVVDAMSAEGIECQQLSTTDEFANEEDATVVERGLCTVGNSTVVISTFEDAQARADWVELNDLAGKVAVAGNWVVGSDSQEIVQDVASSLDATIP